MNEKILLVEDDIAVLLWLEKGLTEGTGASVVAVDSAQKAIAAVQQCGNEIVAAVCDLRLTRPGPRPTELRKFPTEDPAGYSLAQWIHEQLPTAGIFGMTGLMKDATTTQMEWFLRHGDPTTGIGVYRKYLDWSLLRHRVLMRVGRQSAVTVFIVHGHDPHGTQHIADELADYIHNSLKWTPRILKEDDWANQTWIEQIESHAATSQMAWVVMTPDEWACPLRPKSVPQLQSRPNVFIECGYFLGAYGRSSHRVLLIQKGEVGTPSDLHGVGVVRIASPVVSYDVQIRQQLVAWL